MLTEKNRSLRFWISVSLLGCPPVVFAQQQPADDKDNNVIEEVVVSVERVTQTLQSYEGTAATVSQADLDKLGATNLSDLPALMPGVEIANYEDNTQLYVRGIGSNANTELGDPAIAPHLDDVYVPRPRGLGVSFFDIERVEVNVGPQGTVRGRNALGGSINIVSKKPKLGEFEGYGEYSVGNYNQKELRGALNIPLIGDIAAARFSVYSATHDPFIKNTGPLSNVLGWEGQDDIGGRAHFLVKPNDQLSVLLTGDYLQSKGEGTRGVDMFNLSQTGVNFNSVDDPRKVNSIGFTPVQDTRNYGITLNTTYKLDDLFNTQFIGGYRHLHYQAALSTGGRGYDFDGDEQQAIARSGGLVSLTDPIERQQAFINERVYGNFSQLDWDTTSLSRTYELRFTSPDSAEKLTWALGLYKFKESQGVFLGIPQDYNTLPYLEFNQGSTIGESKSAYADVTWAATQKLRLTAGARYSDESKERTGFNYIADLDTNGVAIRTGTPGFRMAGLSRSLRNPDADGDGVPNTINDIILLYRNGVKSFGINDTLSQFLNGQCVQTSQFGGTCANYPGLASKGGGATVQFGENEDKYVDWRFRVGYDLTDNNLLYGLIATGNKAPSFNDTVDLDPGPGTQLFTPPVGPEKATLVELGSKNTIDFAGRPLVLNGSIYYQIYKDQVFSTLVGQELLDNDPNNDAGCRDTNPNTTCSGITLNQNIGKSKNKGVQLDAGYNLDHGFNVAGTFLFQDTKYDSGSVVTDNRRNNPNAGTLQVDLSGNELPLTPPVTLNLRLGQTIPVSNGAVDWIVSSTYKARYFLTAFNGGPGKDGAKNVTATDSTGVATGFGTDLVRLYDRQDAYVHFDLGVGYSREGSDVRVEAFVNNVTDEAHASQASIDGGTQEFVFNPPRTYGVRVHVGF
jgi:iron complex outermembrane receptor protein